MQLRRINAGVFVASLLSLGVATAAPPQRDVNEQRAFDTGCDMSQLSMNICSFYDYKVLDAELNDLYKQQLSRLKEPVNRKRLIAAERAWLTYIEADCLYENGAREESGTIWPFQQNLCMSSHLKQRVDLLKSFLECTSTPCPS